MEYKPTIGLEIHAELKTVTKMFCACKNDPNEKRPNINICPICTGHPGTLPTINKEAIKNVIKIGLSLGGKITKKSEFDRKNYFYPDIPKGYQISQYQYPFITGGELCGVRLNRIHLEEDTAKSSHERADYSLVDFNRAGVPLMELVTEPTIHSAKDVSKFGDELQKVLQYLGVSDANMDKGEMRLEANVSVSKSEKLGTKVEIKNLNSFRSAERAIEFEIKRQIDLLEKGEKITQETRGWDEKKQNTFPQRSKEDSHDYRYFPDPDLPKVDLIKEKIFGEKYLIDQMPETPSEKRKRLASEHGIKESDIDFYISNHNLSALFEKTAIYFSNNADKQTLSNYIVSDLAGLGDKGYHLEPSHLSALIKMVIDKEISSRGAKDIINKMLESKLNPRVIAQNHGLFQKSDIDSLKDIVNRILEKNQKIVLDYKNGKISAIQFLIGQGMKETKGSGNPQVLRSLFEEEITKYY